MHDSLDPNSYENNDNTKKVIDPNRSSKGKLNDPSSTCMEEVLITLKDIRRTKLKTLSLFAIIEKKKNKMAACEANLKSVRKMHN